jgi:hypothetical protein
VSVLALTSVGIADYSGERDDGRAETLVDDADEFGPVISRAAFMTRSASQSRTRLSSSGMSSYSAAPFELSMEIPRANASA